MPHYPDEPLSVLTRFGGFFDPAGKKARLEEITGKMEGQADFWSNPQAAAPILKEKKVLEIGVAQAEKARRIRDDLEVAMELARAGDDDCLAEAEKLVTAFHDLINSLEVQSLLSGELDMNDAVITINAGAGGTESCDWASMLMRMYLMHAEKRGWKAELYDVLDGEGAGIKNATIGVSGEFAYGLLKAESGVHRLVRISPFDANARRHTSFASVYVSPQIDDTIEIDIKEGDVKMDTFRASGAGGQHVNKTDSAVRLTHMPTGTVVSCQTQRSQHQNREQAMKLLRSRLYEAELEKRRAKADAIESSKSDISFGHQIRSYVLHPYKMVKDHRTDHESHQPDSILNGDLDGLIRDYLLQFTKK